jgi:hypothetical protein
MGDQSMGKEKVSEEIESLAELDEGMNLVLQIINKMAAAVKGMDELESKQRVEKENRNAD